MSENLSVKEIAQLEATRKVELGSRMFMEGLSGKNLHVADLRCDLAMKLLDRMQENARFGLRCYMELLSLKHTQQRWAEGLEHALYTAATIDSEKLSVEEQNKLFVLYCEAGGWWVVPDDTDEPKFVDGREWLEIHKAWQKEAFNE